MCVRLATFDGFEQWCHDNVDRSDVVFNGEADEADDALAGYVRHLFRQGATLGKAKLINTIN